MSKSRSKFRALAAVVAGFALASTLIIAPSPAPVAAVTGSEFNAGNIISDSLFYDGQAMTRSEIQAFLNSKIGTCSNGRCLNVLTASVASRARDVSQTTGNLICEAFSGGTLSAAEIIYRAQVACGISAKVILVTLQKEQGLVSAKAPGEAALDRAMGMACPDTAPCAAYALGFGNQVYLGARQLKAYKAAAFAKQPGVHQIQYHPNTSCGSSSVNIVNYATAALYNYTPYRPNAAALANLGGTGDACSSYGNRNFWWFYANWFGGSFESTIVSTDTLSHVLARSISGSLSMFQPDSKGRIAQAENIGSGWGTMASIIPAGDVDGDGHRDILAIDGAGRMWLYPTDGVVGWKPRVQVPGDWGRYTSVFSADRFDGDDWADLMAIDADGKLLFFGGTGRGSFTEPRQIGHGWGNLTQVFSAGDFEGDGNVDVIARDTAGALRLYRGNGAGGWKGSYKIGHGWSKMQAIFAAGDYNRDSANDVFARDSDGAMWVYLGNGRGRWLGRVGIPGNWADYDFVAGAGPAAGNRYVIPPGFGDFNADGTADIVARTSSGKVLLYPSNGVGSWKSMVNTGENFASATALVSIGDLTRDRKPDLLSRDAAGGLWRYSVATDGTLSAPASLGTGWDAYVTMLAGGDLNNDGIPDLLAVNADGVLMRFLGESDGTFDAGTQAGHGWGSMTAIFNIGDFDSDGNTDLVARKADGDLLLYGGNGAMKWNSPVTIGSGWGKATAIVGPGDFDGDGNVDVIARFSDGLLRVYAGNGNGGWKKSYIVGSGWNGIDWIG
ncbi:VCBS repeat protein [Rhodoglobus vestalii]|uniref:VCBS repeat protein n=1 Tax=Rhodoglobus vestalii TaxID=193384 RepID=A0A8H2K8F5_9MICO|nr:FG-GAP-like repeat-containing protein [Rhodoglobus vestalii]TQO20778.1 VCBS repeat protein [Rhodoglobus vestalii]